MVLQWYLSSLQRRPILTQSLMSGVLFMAGDALAQHLVERRSFEAHDWSRTARITSFGLLFAGPAVATWYRLLDRYVVHRNKTVETLQRLVLDQSLVAPSFLAIFLSYMTLAEGGSVQQVKTKLNDVYFDILINNYRVWPLINFANFYFVPLQHRLLVTNSVALVWNTYIAHMAAHKH